MLSYVTNGNKKVSGALFITLAFIALLFFCSASFAAEAIPSESAFAKSLFDSFIGFFESVSGRVYGAAYTLFFALLGCQMTWAVVQLYLQENGTFGGVVIVIARQVIIGAFFYWFLLDRTILETIVNSFRELAGEDLNFTNLMQTYTNCTNYLWKAIHRKGRLSFEGISLFLSGLAASLVMSYAFMCSVGYVAVVMIENHIIGSIGMILLGFGGSEYTRDYAISYIRALVRVGFKLFLMTVTLYAGAITLVQTTLSMEGALETQSVIQACFVLISQSFLFVTIVKFIPHIAESLVSGVSANTASAGASVGGGLGTATGTAAGLAIGAGAMARGAVKGAYEGAKSGAEAGANSFSTDSYGSLRTKMQGNNTAMMALGGVTGLVGGALSGAARAGIQEIARDWGSPSYKGSRSQRFFNSVAKKMETNAEGEMEPVSKDTGNP